MAKSIKEMKAAAMRSGAARAMAQNIENRMKEAKLARDLGIKPMSKKDSAAVVNAEPVVEKFVQERKMREAMSRKKPAVRTGAAGDVGIRDPWEFIKVNRPTLAKKMDTLAPEQENKDFEDRLNRRKK
jgi:hypothetical protein